MTTEVEKAADVPENTPDASANHGEQQASACNTEGFAQRFECRPEFRLGRDLVWDVVDASRVRERKVGDLMVVRIADVLSGDDEIFLGFGVPNAFLVVPKQAEENATGAPGYQKFAGKSLFREPSVIAETRGMVQSGIWIRLRNLPPEAAQRLREAMQYYHGKRFVTCVRACMYVMERAGFGSGNRPLTKHKWPYPLMSHLTDHGLTYEGKPVEFDVIRTSPNDLPSFSYGIRKATILTPIRHANRNKIFSAVKTGLTYPFRLFGMGKAPAPKSRIVAPIAPALPDNVEYLRDLHVRVSMPSEFGALLRLVWGSHALFEVQQNRVKAADYFTRVLPPFPQAHPDRITRIKKRVLFTPFVINRIRGVLAPEFVDSGERSERDLYDMLRTDSAEAPNKYNLVVTSTRIVIARVNNDAGDCTVRSKFMKKLRKIAAWILSKHVLMSGYDKELFYASEVWKDADGVIHINMNSGTYQPTAEEQKAALAFAQAIFPHWRIVID